MFDIKIIYFSILNENFAFSHFILCSALAVKKDQLSRKINIDESRTPILHFLNDNSSALSFLSLYQQGTVDYPIDTPEYIPVIDYTYHVSGVRDLCLQKLRLTNSNERFSGGIMRQILETNENCYIAGEYP